jgi:hypothetical protein
LFAQADNVLDQLIAGGGSKPNLGGDSWPRTNYWSRFFVVVWSPERC